MSVKLHCPNGSPITADVEDNDDGTYSASFTPVSKGDHQITVHVRGKPIQGSSFDLQVWPSVTSSLEVIICNSKTACASKQRQSGLFETNGKYICMYAPSDNNV